MVFYCNGKRGICNIISPSNRSCPDGCEFADGPGGMYVEAPKPKPITNADHIRSMTDEELCDFIVFHTGYRESAWSDPTYYNFLTGGDDTRANADADTLKWLKRPYKENEE